MVLSMRHGGLERIVNKIAKKIDQNQFLTYICSLDGGGPFLDDIPDTYAKKYVFSRKPGLIDASLLVSLIKVVRKEKIDILHSHSGCMFYAASAGCLGGVRGTIHTDHGRLVPDRRGLIWEDFIFSRIIDRFVSVSEELAEYLKNIVRVPSKKLMTIINGVDTQEFKPLSMDTKNTARINLGLSPDSNIIGCVCRLDRVKNIPFLLQTLHNLIKKKGYLLVLVGDGPARSEVENTITELGLQPFIRLFGERSNVSSIIPLFDVFVLPSLSEGTSMTLLEAMACGVPVIASNVGGNPKIIQDGVNGFLFDLNRPDILNQHLQNILSHRNMASRLGKAGRELVKATYSFDRVIKSYCQTYKELYFRKERKTFSHEERNR